MKYSTPSFFMTFHFPISALLLMVCLVLVSSGCGKKTEVTGALAYSEKKASAASAKDTESAGPSSRLAETAPENSKKGSAGASADSSGASSTVPAAISGNGSSSGLAGTSSAPAPLPRKLNYIDAWQERHIMEVDPSVNENPYTAGEWTEKDSLMTLKNDTYTVLRGIDVSEHQGEIDWEAVADAGFEFAFIRVGFRGYGEEGKLVEDAFAISNLKEADAAGLQVGTYFFSQALNEEEAREEAALAVRVIEESGVKTGLPLMYDPELIRDDWGRANEITSEQVCLNTAAFEKEVTALSGSSIRTDIYSNLPWEDKYFDAKTLNRYAIWYADYEKLPQTPYHFTWWQYTNEGTVPGIEGPVDLNLWIRK